VGVVSCQVQVSASG